MSTHKDSSAWKTWCKGVLWLLTVVIGFGLGACGGLRAWPYLIVAAIIICAAFLWLDSREL